MGQGVQVSSQLVLGVGKAMAHPSGISYHFVENALAPSILKFNGSITQPGRVPDCKSVVLKE